MLRLLPVVLAALVGFLTVDAGFVFDDPHALLQNPVVNGEVSWWEAVFRDYWGRPIEGGVNSWRPIMPMLWALLWKAFPNNPAAFHVLSALLHMVTTALAVRLGRALGGSEPWALAVGALFAVHPLNAEAVGAIVAQADLLSFALVLCACLIGTRPVSLRRGLASAALLLVASFVKESAVIFAPLVVALMVMQGDPPRRRWTAAVPTTAVAIAVVAFQLALPRRETVAMWGNTLAHEAEGYQRVLLGLYTMGRSLVMSFWPHPLAPSHGYAAIELHPDVLWPFAAAGAVLLVAGIVGGVWGIRARRTDWVAALFLLYAPALLQSHWFVRLITDLAERLLYPATLGAAMMVATALLRYTPRVGLRRLALTGIVASALLFSISARRAWVSDYALWSQGVRVEPKAMRHQFNLSNALIRRGELDGAAFHRIIAVYLVNRFPERVEWERVETAEALPPEQRFVELPELLYPDAPCPLIVAFLKQNEEISELHRHVLQPWLARYPGCFRVSD